MSFTDKKTGVKIYKSAWNAANTSLWPELKEPSGSSPSSPVLLWVLWPKPACKLAESCSHNVATAHTVVFLARCLSGYLEGRGRGLTSCSQCGLCACLMQLCPWNRIWFWKLLLLYPLPLRKVVVVETHGPHLQVSSHWWLLMSTKSDLINRELLSRFRSVCNKGCSMPYCSTDCIGEVGVCDAHPRTPRMLSNFS